MDLKQTTDILCKKASEKFVVRKDWYRYVHSRNEIYQQIMGDSAEDCMISEANWIIRGGYESAKDVGVQIVPGDICFIDFGQNYINEIGYQHFGLIISMCKQKALVIPMTSNEIQYRNGYDPVDNPNGALNLMRIGKPKGLNKPSVLFLNDARYINTARVIGVKAHICVDSSLYALICHRLEHVMFS